jgi:hypothetical protein
MLPTSPTLKLYAAYSIFFCEMEAVDPFSTLTMEAVYSYLPLEDGGICSTFSYEDGGIIFNFLP